MKWNALFGIASLAALAAGVAVAMHRVAADSQTVPASKAMSALHEQLREPDAAGKVPTWSGAELTDDLIQYRGKDGREAITEPQFVTADQAHLGDGTRVIGIAINGEARAYPLFILTLHQVVNDTVGGEPIAASW